MPFKDVDKRRENVKKWKEVNKEKVKEQKRRWKERKKEERKRIKEQQVRVHVVGMKRNEDLMRKGKWINKVQMEKLPVDEEQVKRCRKREEDIQEIWKYHDDHFSSLACSIGHEIVKNRLMSYM